MNIWILNHHALTPDMSGGTRHYDFAKELIKRGHSVTIIASSFHYSKYKEMREYNGREYLQESIDGVDFIWIKTPPYHKNSVSRVKNMLGYTYKVLSLIPKLSLKKPDVVMGSSVHLFAVWAAYMLSKRYRVSFIMEIRDLWPQTLIDMGISKLHPFILLLGVLEKYMYKRADKIITLLPKAHEYIKALGIEEDKIIWISNGVDFNSIKKEHTKMLDSSKFNVLYAGAHGEANNLEVLIDVADVLKENKKIHFTLIGDGILKEKLIAKAKRLKLQNITFINSVSKDRIYDYLMSADLLYAGLKDLPLYRYGMSMNKMFDYMSAKKPILFVTSMEDSIIKTADAGKTVKPDDIDKISDSILWFSIQDSQTLQKFANNGYIYLKNNFSIEILADKLEKILEDEAKKSNV